MHTLTCVVPASTSSYSSGSSPKRPRCHHDTDLGLHSTVGSGDSPCSSVPGLPPLLPPPLCLPWLPDRFYINEIAGVVGEHREEEEVKAQDGCGEGRMGGGGGGGRRRKITFSLGKLVEVVNADGWPGIKAAVFGTFSLEMRCCTTRNCTIKTISVALVLYHASAVFGTLCTWCE